MINDSDLFHELHAGMRERAEGIGAMLKVWSRTAAGTEVELHIPGSVAYQRPSGNGLVSWLVRLFDRRAQRGKLKGDLDK